MKLTDYAIKSLRLDRELRSSSRIVAYALDAFRHASIMALLLLCLDLTPFALYPTEEPRRRLTFIILWALLMALINLVRNPSVEATLDKADRDAST